MIKHYKDRNGNYFGFELPEQQDLIQDDMVELSPLELEELINPKPTKSQYIAVAEEQKQLLLTEANDAIAPLQDAVDLDMSTEEEVAQLTAWKKYHVLLNRVDTSTAPDIEWPEKPTK